MQNRDIAFKGDKVVLSRETYEELKAFCAMHGETDLPAWPAPSPELIAHYSKSEPPQEVKKLTDE